MLEAAGLPPPSPMALKGELHAHLLEGPVLILKANRQLVMRLSPPAQIART
jgi:hypothetical protein